MSDLRPKNPNLKGGLAALVIVAGWAATLITLLSVELPPLSAGLSALWWVPLALGLQTFLYTGLFITAHDAMHSTITPDYPRLNRLIGILCVVLYALFSFRRLHHYHWEHHRHPASEKDPDYHDEKAPGTLRWYLRFMTHYVTVRQLLSMALLFNVLLYLVGVPLWNLLLFWVVPALLSTVQLFYFGTVLPHRRPPQGYADRHRARSNDFAPWLSFLTCYHFGYHWEHHERPDLPWWALPRYRRHRLQHASKQP